MLVSVTNIVLLLLYAKYNDRELQNVLCFVPVVVNKLLRRNNKKPYRLLDRRLPVVLHRTFVISTTAATNCNNIHNYETNNNKNYTPWDYGCASIAGSDPDRSNKVNQDGSFYSKATFLQQNYSITVFGVLDGHGRKGHEVVNYLQRQLPIRMQEYLERTLKVHSHHDDVIVCKQSYDSMTNVNGVKHPQQLPQRNFSLHEQKLELLTVGHADPAELYYDNVQEMSQYPIQQAIVDAFIHVQYDMRHSPNVPASRSGTTCVCCILMENILNQRMTLYTANVGDSRAILIMSCQNNTLWHVAPLSTSTTVTINTERDRIVRTGEGRIDSNGNVFYGPIGISMTRSLGNSVMLRAGIVPIPFVTLQDFSISSSPLPSTNVASSNYNNTYFICAGTDGIFDVLTNEQVMNIIQQSDNSKQLNDISTEICSRARLAWLADLPLETKVDDCTIAILTLPTNNLTV
jgi:serine/threonine protein phosphatase PrpC